LLSAGSRQPFAGGFIFVSGTPGLDLGTGKVVSDSFEEQARQSFRNIGIILEEAGSHLSKVVKTTTRRRGVPRR